MNKMTDKITESTVTKKTQESCRVRGNPEYLEVLKEVDNLGLGSGLIWKLEHEKEEINGTEYGIKRRIELADLLVVHFYDGELSPVIRFDGQYILEKIQFDKILGDKLRFNIIPGISDIFKEIITYDLNPIHHGIIFGRAKIQDKIINRFQPFSNVLIGCLLSSFTIFQLIDTFPKEFRRTFTSAILGLECGIISNDLLVLFDYLIEYEPVKLSEFLYLLVMNGYYSNESIKHSHLKELGHPNKNYKKESVESVLKKTLNYDPNFKL